MKNSKKEIKKYIKPALKDLKITDDFLFKEVMSEKEMLVPLIKGIFSLRREKVELTNIKSVSREKYFKVRADGKEIYMDIVASSKMLNIDLEMQKTRNKNIPKRTRVYSSMLDSRIIKSGTNFLDVKDNYIIFLCMFDLYGKGKLYYEFEHYDKINKLSLNDGVHIIIINLTSKEINNKNKIDENLKAFIDIANDRKNNSAYGKELEKQIKFHKNDEKTKRRYDKMSMLDLWDAREEGMEEGLAKGRKQGIKEGKFYTIVKLVKDGAISEDVAIDNLKISKTKLKQLMKSY